MGGDKWGNTGRSGFKNPTTAEKKKGKARPDQVRQEEKPNGEHAFLERKKAPAKVFGGSKGRVGDGPARAGPSRHKANGP